MSILHLLPTPLTPEGGTEYLPQNLKVVAQELRHFACEEIRTVRRFLRQVDKSFPIDDSVFWQVNKDTKPHELAPIVRILKEGKPVGVMSEAGCPGVADPGAILVQAAHQNGITVKPWVGPSSFLLALMASGLNGQSFAFHGYLPINEVDRMKQIRLLEANARKLNQTQLVMETPFRNPQLWATMLKALDPNTLLCVAAALNSDHEFVKTATVKWWRTQEVPSIHKVPAVFLFL